MIAKVAATVSPAAPRSQSRSASCNTAEIAATTAATIPSLRESGVSTPPMVEHLPNALVQLRAILPYDTQPNDLAATVCCNVR
jgi:hypothetical protein